MAQGQDQHVHVLPAAEALERALRRALRNHKRVQKKLKADPVHDLRVALRRCRSLSEGFSAIDPDPVWRKLRKVSKRQQDGLSELRDVQVLSGWLKPLRLTAGPAGRALGTYFERRERRARRKARSSVKSFPRKRFKRWLRRLPLKADLIPTSERELAQIPLEVLSRVIELDERYLEERTPEVWHDLRVRVKRFRYMVESFVPQKSEAWAAELARAQDLLGEGHDLDVLRDRIEKLSRKKTLHNAPAAVKQALKRVDVESQKRRKEYMLLVGPSLRVNGRTSGAEESAPKERHSLWDRWRAELESISSSNRRAGEESSKSLPNRALRVVAPTHRYPDKQRRIS